MAELPHVGEANFINEVLEAKFPVLVDFTAIWCSPCKLLDPIVKQLAQDWEGKVKVVKLDVDDNADLATQYQVLGLPTLMLFKAGKPVERLNGYQSKDRIASKFTPHLNGG
jgi:thioredoxin 1